ncbi:MAG: polyribonucleotide nucleotidyltransferase [Anaerohalosphaeraceae bacterium]|nr:polyribonucleotide nucleotidyltransferase [Anaerohalosphaeraceae bacterium]
MSIHKIEKQIGGKTISIETGKIAKQAHGAVVVRSGDTMVLVSAVTAAPYNPDIDYFPLSVDYREKLSAAGKFPGGFMKREGRPSTKEILTARMIDRPIRPLFPDGYFQEVQIMVTVISADQENDPDVLAMVGASAALSISKIPFQGPLGACRLGRIDGSFVINPSHEQRVQSDFNLILAGRPTAINMIEVDAKQVPEDVAAAGIKEAHKAIGEICGMIDELVALCGVEKEMPEIEWDNELADKFKAENIDKYREIYQIKVKADRSKAIKELMTELAEKYCTAQGDAEPLCSKSLFKRIMHEVERDAIREMILAGNRPDGRGDDDVRDISCEVGFLPRAHGSALFTRGETQALISITLGTGRDEQTVDGLLEEFGQKFMLHYNFPPYSVGEARPIRGPGRREIGHGALAEKALEQVRPGTEDFPYTIKIVSDITESNGSSSMASVCGGTLAMLDAGVPLLKPVAGISVGMITDDKQCKLITDIIGNEDHFGDMDFKVAGTVDGITAIQLDIKAEGLEHDMMVQALEKARVARLKILDIMATAIDKPREQLSTYAPKMTSIKIDPDLIGKIIGPGGKMIKGIQEKTGANIEIEEDGTVYISCVGGDGHLEARNIVQAMTEPPVVGRIYEKSRVVSVKDFGAFVEIVPGIEGLCHVSEISDEYVKNTDSVCKVGDVIDVKLLSIDDQGRLKLSRKAVLIEAKKNAAPAESDS